MDRFRGLAGRRFPLGTSYASLGGIASVIPVDIVVPGCPPTSVQLIHGILAAVEGGAEAERW